MKNPAAVALGKLGGSSKSSAKRKAARENGAAGGRPCKKPVLWIIQTAQGQKRTWAKSRTEAIAKLERNGLKAISIRKGTETDMDWPKAERETVTNQH